jgi:uncharacterized protein
MKSPKATATVQQAEADEAEAEDKSAKAADQEKWTTAVDRYRDTAKWAIGAFAAIGVIFAGTAPLAGLGNVQSDRIDLVVLGAALGLLGVGLAIAATVTTLVPRTVFQHELRAKEQGWFRRWFTGLGPLEDNFAKHPDSLLPAGIRSPGDLTAALRNLRRLIGTTSKAMIDTSKPAAERKKNAEANHRYTAKLAELEQWEQELLLIGRFEKARAGFRLAIVAMVIGALAAGAGLGLLLYGMSDATAAAKANAEVAKIEAETSKLNSETAKIEAEIVDLKNSAGTSSGSGSDALSTAQQVLGEVVVGTTSERRIRSFDLKDGGGLKDYASHVGLDVSALWAQAFAESGRPYHPPQFVWLATGQARPTPCGRAGKAEPAFYCPDDATIYVYLPWMYRDVYQAFGDRSGFAVATVIAHEVAHHAQAELGLVGEVMGRKLELHADCLAGIWARSAYAQGRVMRKEILASLRALVNAGDLTALDPSAGGGHGTTTQRSKWFTFGFEDGDINSCDLLLAA